MKGNLAAVDRERHRSMRRHDRHTNELIARVMERFLHSMEGAKDPNPVLSGFAKEICGIWMAGMWMLTQV